MSFSKKKTILMSAGVVLLGTVAYGKPLVVATSNV